MKIESIKFLGSYTKIEQIPSPRLPEIAFSGRSNVGKSSLINCLVNRKKIALTSSTPGKTRTLNYYSINEQIYFVDLPGYGFAKVPQSERIAWKNLIESYLSDNKHLKGVIQIIDSRHGFTKLDMEMMEWLSIQKIPVLIVATKIDKLPRSKSNSLLQKIEKEAVRLGGTGIVPFSKITKYGKFDIWKSIQELI
ncbi:hypothetical protein B6I21_03305 [candidate division KSB1 bacterium 4572_119]|nr:MAG: hypothetical protein B6I21_03305 [candidate division KSB1 bacterium 4572_119]